MSAATAIEADGTEIPPKRGGKKKLILLAVPVLVVVIGAGLWFSGLLSGLLGAKPKGDAKSEAAHAPVFVELPEMVANLNAGPHRTSFVKLRAKLELERAEDGAAVTAAMPRLVDLFQTYLRETRPEELRGSAGTYRLREALLNRAQIAAAPAKVRDVLFVELLVQ